MSKNLIKIVNICVALTLFFLCIQNKAETVDSSHAKVVFCQFASWSSYRFGRGMFVVENIDASFCTHIVYAFVGMDVMHNEVKSVDPFQDFAENGGRNSYFKLISLKRDYPHLKVILALGGWNEGSVNYSIMCADPLRRTKFIASIVNYVKRYNFDGFTLDWRFPGQRGGTSFDKINLVPFMRELKASFVKHELLLIANLSPAKFIIDSGYDIKNLAPILDYILMMCYDYHGYWDMKFGLNAPLKSGDVSNVEYTINYVIKLGAIPKKLVLGIPLYGRTFIFPEPSPLPKFGGLVSAEAFKGTYSQDFGFLGYNEICLELQNTSAEWVEHWHEESSTPFAVSGKKVISYDNEKSVSEKVEFAIMNKLAGVMVWSVDTDDFLGDCGNKTVTYPLMRAIDAAVKQFSEKLRRESIADDYDDMPEEQHDSTENSRITPQLIIIYIVIWYSFWVIYT